MMGNEYSHDWKSQITLWEFLQTHLYNSVKCAIPCTGIEWYPSFDDEQNNVVGISPNPLIQ